MQSTKDILPLTLKMLGVKRQLDLHAVILHWSDIVGAEIAQQSRPTRAKGGMLFVAVKAPAWGHHLSMLKVQLLDNIHKYLGQKLLSDIKFYAGDFLDYTNSNTDEPPFSTRMRSVAIDDSQRMEIQATVHAVTDSQLKYRLQRLILKDKKRRKLLLEDGWKACSHCSAICLPGELFCTTCSLKNRGRKREEIRNLLLDAPWLDFQEAASYIICTEREFIKAKQELILSLTYRIDVNNPRNMDIALLSMLLYKVMPDSLDEEIFEKTLRFIRRNRYVFTPRR